MMLIFSLIVAVCAYALALTGVNTFWPDAGPLLRVALAVTIALTEALTVPGILAMFLAGGMMYTQKLVPFELTWLP